MTAAPAFGDLGTVEADLARTIDVASDPGPAKPASVRDLSVDRSRIETASSQAEWRMQNGQIASGLMLGDIGSDRVLH